MRRKRLLWIAPLAILAMAAFLFLGGAVVMWLWNWLMPALFGLPHIRFWQAFALLALCRILFGGWGRMGRPGRSRMGERMAERWATMTPEEREKWRESFRGRWACGAPPPPPGTTPAS